MFGLKPRNKEQLFSIDLLLDPSVKIVSLIGAAGCGKTTIALACGLKQCLDEQIYEKLIVTKPVNPVGRDIGFLPGTKEEKMDPWIAPIKDNLNFLFGNKNNSPYYSSTKNSDSTQQKGKKNIRVKKDGEPPVVFKSDPYIQMLFESGKIEVEAITYMRGRSIANAFMIIDEAQNLTNHELKTIITRVGEGTKIILLGDIQQIDVPYLDMLSNGLTYSIEKFKNSRLSGHVTLIKGERSELATLAAEIL